jgi:RNA polymerase sigma-70 factor (ECF subfamily)
MDSSEALVANHGADVWRTIGRLLGGGADSANGADAADCFQDTFVAYIEISRREKIASPVALLKRIATTRSLDLIRRKTRARQRMASLPDDLPSLGGQPDENLVADELAEFLRQEILKLDEAHEVVFCLTQLEGMPNQEAGRVLGISANQVAVRLHRARTQLQRRILESEAKPVRR